LSFWFVVLDQFAGWRGRLTGSGDSWPLSADIIVFALRKSTAAPCHQDEQGFDPQRMASAQACLRRNRAPGRAACAGSRVQRGIASTRWRHGIHSELARENGSAIRNVSSRARTSLISRQVTAILL
jgi:hypothetical protein